MRMTAGARLPRPGVSVPCRRTPSVARKRIGLPAGASGGAAACAAVVAGRAAVDPAVVPAVPLPQALASTHATAAAAIGHQRIMLRESRSEVFLSVDARVT